MNPDFAIIGDLIYDTTLSQYGIVVDTEISFTDADGNCHFWGYSYLTSSGCIEYSDLSEIKVMRRQKCD